MPPYRDTSVKVEVEVQVIVVSCGKMSDPHSLTYKPVALKNGKKGQEVRLLLYLFPPLNLWLAFEGKT